jgi:hypothetical protein
MLMEIPATGELQSWRTAEEISRRRERQAKRARTLATTPAEASATLLRSIRDYPELIRAIDARRIQLGLTMLEMDDLTGMADGWSSKVLAGIKNLGPTSLTCFLEALKVDLVLIEWPFPLA